MMYEVASRSVCFRCPWPLNIHAQFTMHSVLDSMNSDHLEARCCEICSRWRSPSRCRCRYADPHHLPHSFCRATDQNNLVAQVAALDYKINQSAVWLSRNLALIFVASSLLDDIGFICHIVAFINIINILYYIMNIIKLFEAKCLLMADATKKRRSCRMNQNLPNNLIRYFENSSFECLSRYWNCFSQLVGSLREIRESKFGRWCTETGMETELKILAESLREKQELEWKNNLEIANQRYHSNESMIKYNRKSLYTERQLQKYWNDFARAVENKSVRFSKESETIMPRLEYQLSTKIRSNALEQGCTPNGTSLVEFLDFMKAHHKQEPWKVLRWVSNLKYWLSCKMKEVIEQFETINSTLMKFGASHMQIGKSDLTALHSALSLHKELRSFVPMLAFLTPTRDQSYLLWRYRAMSCGNWTLTSHPLDSDIIIMFFSNYLDMRLPPMVSNPSSKRPFTDAHVVWRQNPTQLESTSLAIVRQCETPPHYNVVLQGQVHRMPTGCDNLLVALTYLVYCFKIYHEGKIGRIPLGKCGLNLLWVLDDDAS